MPEARRRICWPDPDACCAEGGCIYCSDSPVRKTRRQIADASGVAYDEVWMHRA